MAPNLELSDQAKKECAEALSRVLSDTFLVYLKTHNYHWNVVGPQFLAVHNLFEQQYRNLWESIDDIAERVRALGAIAPGTTMKFRELSEIRENDKLPAANEMVRELVADNEIVARSARAALSTAQAAGDEATAGLLTDRLAYHEKQIWMMKSLLAA